MLYILDLLFELCMNIVYLHSQMTESYKEMDSRSLSFLVILADLEDIFGVDGHNEV